MSTLHTLHAARQPESQLLGTYDAIFSLSNNRRNGLLADDRHATAAMAILEPEADNLLNAWWSGMQYDFQNRNL